MLLLQAGAEEEVVGGKARGGSCPCTHVEGLLKNGAHIGEVGSLVTMDLGRIRCAAGRLEKQWRALKNEQDECAAPRDISGSCSCSGSSLRISIAHCLFLNVQCAAPRDATSSVVKPFPV